MRVRRFPLLLAVLTLTAACGADAAAPTPPVDTTNVDTSAATDTGDGSDVGAPTPPNGLVRYLSGADADRAAAPAGPGLLLMGGGTDVDEAFTWWLARTGGGDVVVLRASGADGYNPYLYDDLGGVDSVETHRATPQLGDHRARHPALGRRRCDDASGPLLRDHRRARLKPRAAGARSRSRRPPSRSAAAPWCRGRGW